MDCSHLRGAVSIRRGAASFRHTRMFAVALATIALALTGLVLSPLLAYADIVDGTVKAWGNNTYGQLGDGTFRNRLTPVNMSGDLTGVQAIAAGYDQGYALLADGTVKAWGLNTSGQLGDGTTTNRYTPVSVSGLTGVQAIAAGYYSGYALLADGTVKAWGYNSSGELGDGTTTNRYTPVDVSGLTGVQAIAGGGSSGYALLADGTVKAWGRNTSGQLGNATFSYSSTPVSVSDLTDVKAIAGGGEAGYALLEDGTVKAWGRNDYGQLGNGRAIDSTTPVSVSGLSNVKAIAANAWSAYALLADGTVKAWGSNSLGELGDGTTRDRYTPVDVSGLTGVQAIAGGDSTTYVLLSDGTVKAWGYNCFGQLGDGTTTSRSTPMVVSGLTNVQTIAAGMYSGYAVTVPQHPQLPMPTTTILTADQTSVLEGDTVTLTATVAPAAAGFVEFFTGATSLGTADTDANNGVATLATTILPVGTNSVNAVFTPADPTAFGLSTSNEVSVTVSVRETDTEEDTPSSPDDGDTPSSPDDGDTVSEGNEEAESDTLPQTGVSDGYAGELGLAGTLLLAAGAGLTCAGRQAFRHFAAAPGCRRIK